MRYGGLKGWPTTHRCGLAQSACSIVIANPDVLEAMITPDGVALSMLARMPRLTAASSGPQPQPLEDRPGRVPEPEQVGLGLRGGVVDVHVEAHPQIVQRPATADHA